jgi:hypothetical protein
VRQDIGLLDDPRAHITLLIARALAPGGAPARDAARPAFKESGCLDFLSELGIPGVSPWLTPGIDIHSYRPTPARAAAGAV